MRFLDLAEGFSQCMAFIDHDIITSKLYTSWALVHDHIVLERKAVSKRLRPLEEDKKADPDLVAKLRKTKDNHDLRKAKASIACAKFKYMQSVPLDQFLRDTNYQPDIKQMFKKKKV